MLGMNFGEPLVTYVDNRSFGDLVEIYNAETPTLAIEVDGDYSDIEIRIAINREGETTNLVVYEDADITKSPQLLTVAIGSVLTDERIGQRFRLAVRLADATQQVMEKRILVLKGAPVKVVAP